MVAIMQQNDIAASDNPQAMNHGRGGLRFPIPGPLGPHDDAGVAEAPHHSTELRPAKAERRAHPASLATHRGGNSFAAMIEFARDRPRREKREVWMRFRVIANLMAARGDGAREFGKSTDMTPNDEECCLNSMRVEKFQQAGSDSRVWSVVECERHRSRVASEANRAAEELRLRMDAAPSGDSGAAQCNRARDDCRIHVTILPCKMQ